MERAVEAVADVLVDGWPETVADRATNYVSDQTWKRLMARGRTRRCRGLADLASAILAAKTKLHELVGWLAGGLMGLLGWGKVEQQLARELAEKIPLPPDAKLVATA